MLWSLLKIVVFVAAIAFLSWGASQLGDTDAAIRLAVGNTEFTLGPLQTVIALLLLIFAIWLLIQLAGLLVTLLKLVNGDDTPLRRRSTRRRERRGLDALGEAMLALASGEGRDAQSKAERAERYLDRPDLTKLLIAQGAEMAGDTSRAEAVYKDLVRDERTRFVGVRGLLKQRLESGDTDTALALAEKAFALRPRNGETQDTLLRLQAGQHDWAGARRTLGAKLRHGNMPRDLHKRRDAVLALGQAQDVAAEDATVEAREAAIEANKQSPTLIPAAAMAARSYTKRDQTRNATRVLKKAWEVEPHPDLAAAFAEIVPGETPSQRVERFKSLTKINPDHPETQMLLAELHIANEDFPAARRALGRLATESVTARSAAIMAAIERGEGADDAVVRGWLTRAVNAPRGPQWVCDNCHSIHGDWAPVCSNCGALDTLAWREPREGSLSLPAQTAMLPLVVSPGAGQVVAPEMGGADRAPGLERDRGGDPSETEIVSDTAPEPEPDSGAATASEQEPEQAVGREPEPTSETEPRPEPEPASSPVPTTPDSEEGTTATRGEEPERSGSTN